MFTLGKQLGIYFNKAEIIESRNLPAEFGGGHGLVV